MPSAPELSRHERIEHPKNIPDAVREFVLDRDNAQCQVCGTTGDNRLHLHHWKHFRSQGGGHEPENLVVVCFRCHDAIHEGRIDIELVEWRPGRWTAFVRRERWQRT